MDFTSKVFELKPETIKTPIFVDAERQERTVTGDHYAACVKRAAVGLWHAGFQDQDCLGLLSNNDIYYHILGDGAVAAGGVFCPMQTTNRVQELIHQIRTAEITWLFAAPEFLDLAMQTAKEGGLPESRVYVFDPPGATSASSTQPRYSTLLESDERQWSNPNKGKDPAKRLMLRMFSSGTTGVPKAVNITHTSNVARMIRPGEKFLGGIQSGSRRFLQFIPVYHMSSLTACNRGSLGQQIVYISSEKEISDVPAVIDQIKTYQITHASLPPRFLEAFLGVIGSGTRKKEDLESLLSVRCGGSAIDYDTARGWRHLFPDRSLMLSYGSTECNSIATTFAILGPGFVGLPQPDVDLRIIDPETLQEVPPGESGEICVRGVQNYVGYNKNPSATRSSTLLDPDGKGDFFRTGDRGFLSPEHGQLAITGRYKEIFKVHSKEVAPEEVEKIICQHPAIQDAAVSAKPARDNKSDQEVVAYVVKKNVEDTNSVSAQEIVDWVREKLSSHKVPTGGVIFTKGIPRNAMHKIVRRELSNLPVMEGSEEFLNVS